MTDPSNPNKEGSAFQWSAVAVAVAAMVYFAALYEPIRLILVFYEEKFMNVGGVGGVGGLANLKGPSDANTGSCDESESGHDNFKGMYCYEAGWRGTPLTPFAWTTLVLWVGPLLIACLFIQVRYSSKRTSGSPHHGPSDLLSEEAHVEVSNPQQPLLSNHSVNRPASNTLSWVTMIWFGLNFLWFLVPFTQFSFGLREIPGAFARRVLAIGLAAAHPLSWNAAFVVIPTGGILTRLILPQEKFLSNTKIYWFEWHRLLGYFTVFWAVVHGGCELVYLSLTNERFRHAFDLFDNGESLLYLSGFTTLTVFIVHAFLAYFRKRFDALSQNHAVSFRRLHSTLAALILVLAACHWWPFALFFVPATAIQGATWGEAIFLRNRQGRAGDLQLSRRQSAGLLATSIVASLVLGFLVAWRRRQDYMLSSSANLYIPFVFPVLSVIMSLLASSMVTLLTLMVLHRLTDNPRVSGNADYQEIPDQEGVTECVFEQDCGVH